MTQEASHVVVIFIQGQPGARNSALEKLCVPPSHESGLAVSGRCGHDNDLKYAVQHIAGRIKPRPWQRFPRPGGGKQLALDYRALVSFACHTLKLVRRVQVIRTYLTPNF
jgi:hypothetical protein